MKKFNSTKFEKELKAFVQKQYDDYVKGILGASKKPVVSFAGVMTSRKYTKFTFNASNDKISKGCDIWVGFNDWADGKNSISSPEVNYYEKSDGTIGMDMHLG